MAKPLKIWDGTQWVEVSANTIDTSNLATTAYVNTRVVDVSADDQVVIAYRMFV